MPSSPPLRVLVFTTLVAFAGCGSEPAVFGAEQRYAEGDRPIDWEVSREDRLQLSQVTEQRPPRGYTAPTPAGWRELPPEPGRFKDLLFAVGDGDAVTCYLTASVGGGLDGNVARWYTQFGQTLEVRANTLPQHPLMGQVGHLVELEGSFRGEPDMMLLGLIAGTGDRCTTLKMTGPSAVVRTERARFLELAEQIKPLEGAAEPEQPAAEEAEEPADDEVRGLSSFTTPEGWRRVRSSSSMRLLSYKMGEQTECSVIALGGDGGGLLPNLNRWRGQVGHPEIAEEDLASMEQVQVFGAATPLLELRGEFSDAMTRRSFDDAFFLGVVAVQPQQAFFVKLTGPYEEAQPHRQAFIEFCASLER